MVRACFPLQLNFLHQWEQRKGREGDKQGQQKAQVQGEPRRGSQPKATGRSRVSQGDHPPARSWGLLCTRGPSRVGGAPVPRSQLAVNEAEQCPSLSALTTSKDTCASPHLTHLGSPPPLQPAGTLMTTPLRTWSEPRKMEGGCDGDQKAPPPLHSWEGIEAARGLPFTCPVWGLWFCFHPEVK